jgi:hypothetical protein
MERCEGVATTVARITKMTDRSNGSLLDSIRHFEASSIKTGASSKDHETFIGVFGQGAAWRVSAMTACHAGKIDFRTATPTSPDAHYLIDTKITRESIGRL